MIQRIRNSRAFKLLSVFLIMNIVAEIVIPTSALALTGGPAQPEFGSFTPIGASDMVDLSSGDMNYNIPLMDVGGYPLNIAYSSGVGMDDEASWVGLGWNLSVGQINRNVRGIPDDFKGDKLTYENDLKPNVTVGANLKVQPSVFGFDLPENVNANIGVAAMYNNYEGFTMKPSIGMNVELSKNVSVGFNAESGPDGLSVSPSLSVHKKGKDKEGRNTKMGGTVGVSMNSRQGITSTSLNFSRSVSEDVTKKIKAGKNKGQSFTESTTVGSASVGSSIGFADNSYTPSKRVGMNTGSFTVNATLGAEFFGGEGGMDITAYGTVQKVRDEEKYKQVRSYGYEHTEKATRYDVVDFNREKESAVTVNATNLPVTNYTYDIYSVQGQGVSGMYRPYRNQVGYVFDAHVQDGSFSGSLGLEFGAGNAAHLGIDIEVTDVNSYSGLWDNDNYMLQYLKETYNYNPRYEKVHYKNVGDLSVDEEMTDNYTSMFNRTGRYQALRVSFVGNKFHRRAVSEYKKKYNGEGNEDIVNAGSPVKRSKRQSRNQAVFNLSIGEVRGGVGYGPIASNDGSIASVYAKTTAQTHHTGEVQIIRNDGARYIYGLPAYNITKREATFAVYGSSANQTTGLVGYAAGVDNSTSNNIHDEYFNRVTTPAYAHTYLLSSVLSTDYQDKGTNGPSDDDLGSYTKFTYDLKDANYKWRVPYEENKASYNEGLRTDEEDDQGNYVYGEKELFFIKKIETKTHIAIFTISARHDAHGVKGENGGRDDSEDSYKLDKISLYSKAEYYTDINTQTTVNPNAVPIKEVNFVYDYTLCPNVPNNDQAAETVDGVNINASKGKLTLKRIYFTYRGSKMGKYNSYKFNYDNQNPAYNSKGYDYWGNYKPNTGDGSNTGGITAPEYAFTEQNKTTQDSYAAAWSMSSIDLPSGGRISVSYESDDYAYVQDKAALRMFKIVAAGDAATKSTAYLTSGTNCSLYSNGIQHQPNEYLYVDLGTAAEVGSGAATEKQITASKLTSGLGENIHFRFLTNMTQAGGDAISNSDKCDYVTGYMQLASNPVQIFEPGDGRVYASIRVKTVDRNGGNNVDNAVHPVTMAAWNFGRKYLNKFVYSNQPNGDTDDIEEIVADLLSGQVLNNLKEILTGPNATLENKLIGRNFIREKAWVRLKEPTGRKLGGGCRVKEIRTTDVWEQMNNEALNNPNGYQTMNYGQSYKYELSDGRTSGVATYEPIGNKENPFVQPVFSTTKHILAPDEENYMEMPFGESFFPTPQVTYSRIVSASIAGGAAPVAGQQVKQLHKTGHIVTEFYTSRDYPTLVDQTILEAEEDKRELLDNLLKFNTKKHFTASQGYVIHLNDMNGKQKSQRVYAEGQNGFISGVDYLYDNYSTPQNYNASLYPERNKGTLNNEVKVIYPNGDVRMKVIGVEEDVVNDFMSNETESQTLGVNTNLATFFIGIIPGIVPIPLPDISKSEDRFRAVSTTKVINTFGILKETIAYSDGASVSTRNLAWDAITGEVLVTETTDEFNDKYYTMNYPAHWYYRGMGQASANLGFQGELNGSGNVFSLEDIGVNSVTDFLIPGDEIVYGSANTHAWVTVISGNNFRLVDATGANIASIAANTPFKVVRSGYRNLQSAGIMNVTLMKNPLKHFSTGVDITNLGTGFLNSANWNDWRIINAGAVDYSDNWPAGCECGNATTNPYLNNSKGVWRTKSSRTYLTGRSTQASVNPRLEGFFTSFRPMYRLSSGGNFVKDMTNWTYVAEVSRFSPYGFELENNDALYRYSAAQYGYNNTLPMAVGSNTRYRQIGFDGFEDYGFNGCTTNTHFSFEGSNGTVNNTQSHTGKYSFKVVNGQRARMTKPVTCQ